MSIYAMLLLYISAMATMILDFLLNRPIMVSHIHARLMT